MPDPVSVSPGPDVISAFAKLFAVYGVYAVLAVYLFYQQHVDRRNLAEASGEEERKFFQRQYARTKNFLIVLCVAAIGVFLFSGFVLKKRYLVEGEFKNLHRGGTTSENWARSEITAIHDRLFELQRFGDNHLDVEWLLVASKEPAAISFRFQHRTPRHKDPAANLLSLGSQKRIKDAEEEVIDRYFCLDSTVVGKLSGQRLEFFYEHDESEVAKLGQLVLRSASGLKPIEFAEDLASCGSQSTRPVRTTWIGFPSRTVLAQGEDLPNQPRNWEERAVGLISLLGSESLNDQETGRQQLVRQGAHFPRYLEVILENGSEENPKADWNLLVLNLELAARSLQEKGISLPEPSRVVLSQALLDAGHYEASLRWLEPILQVQDANSALRLQHAVTLYLAEGTERSIPLLEELAENATDPTFASLTRSNLGAIYLASADLRQAGAQFEKALDLDSGNDLAREGLALLSNVGVEPAQEMDEGIN